MIGIDCRPHANAHPVPVFRYAVAHGFPPDKISLFALHTIDLPTGKSRGGALREMGNTLFTLPHCCWLIWQVIYREDWLSPIAADGSTRQLVCEAYSSPYIEQIDRQVKKFMLAKVSQSHLDKPPQWDLSS